VSRDVDADRDGVLDDVRAGQDARGFLLKKESGTSSGRRTAARKGKIKIGRELGAHELNHGSIFLLLHLTGREGECFLKKKKKDFFFP